MVSTDGKFGCTTGFSRFMNAADTARVERKGTYITCWQLGALGSEPDGPGPAFVHYAATDAVMLGGVRFGGVRRLSCRSDHQVGSDAVVWRGIGGSRLYGRSLYKRSARREG